MSMSIRWLHCVFFFFFFAFLYFSEGGLLSGSRHEVVEENTWAVSGRIDLECLRFSSPRVSVNHSCPRSGVFCEDE